MVGGGEFAIRLSPKSIKDIQRTRRRVFQEARRLKRNFRSIPGQLGLIGQRFAQAAAPYDTGTLFKAIKHRDVSGDIAQVYVDDRTLTTNPGSRPWNKNFNYALHMHIHNGQMGRGRRIKSGEPRFMMVTRDFLLKEMGRQIQLKLRR